LLGQRTSDNILRINRYRLAFALAHAKAPIAFRIHVGSHIYKTAMYLGLSTEVKSKPILTDSEFELFYNQIMRKTQRVPNWKHTYTACVLAYTTGVLTGSFVVTKGYQQGARLGLTDSGHVRAEAHCLRRKDLEWNRKENEVAAKVTFRFSKGHQDPYIKAYVDGERSVFLAPKRVRLFLDLNTLPFTLAIERGLFTESFDDILKGDNVFLQVDPVVAEQAIFVATDTNGMMMHPAH
jgi:hypothetical protein